MKFLCFSLLLLSVPILAAPNTGKAYQIWLYDEPACNPFCSIDPHVGLNECCQQHGYLPTGQCQYAAAICGKYPGTK